MTAFKQAARAALERVYTAAPNRAAQVERASLDIALDGTRELVSMTVRDAQLSWSCTCKQDACAHAHAALLLLSGAEASRPIERAEERVGVGFSGRPSSQSGMQAVRPSQTGMQAVGDRRTVAETASAPRGDNAALCEGLSDLITAAVRGGTKTGASASVEEALARLIHAAPQPLPSGLSRWGGRLKAALLSGDFLELARLLQAASQLVDDLQASQRSQPAQSRVLSFMGAPSPDSAGVERLTDVTLIELARERLPSLERAGIERRYLVDPQDGAMYCEERVAGSPTSLGPCPRQLSVWLSLVERSAPPTRVRFLQYAVSPSIEPDAWQQVRACAQLEFAPLLSSYRDMLTSFAGLCEPCVLLAPTMLDVQAAAPALVDASGHALPLFFHDRPALLGALRNMLAGAQPQWIVGRLLDHQGALGFLPLSCAVLRHGRLCYARL
jgi:hypothetical protein